MSPDEREAIAVEIRQTLDRYAEAHGRRDADEISSFWGDSGGLRFSGDGAVSGGYQEWSRHARVRAAGRDRWLRWKWRDMRVEVLSTDASTSTLDFEVTKLTVDGDLLHIRGTATHVFRKHSGRWRVVETSGTTVEF